MSARPGEEDVGYEERTIRSRPPAPCLRTYGEILNPVMATCQRKEYDVLTKSSNPSKVPVNSRSFFMMTHIREPMHRSISSRQIYCHQTDLLREKRCMARTNQGAGSEKPWKYQITGRTVEGGGGCGGGSQQVLKAPVDALDAYGVASATHGHVWPTGRDT